MTENAIESYSELRKNALLAKQELESDPSRIDAYVHTYNFIVNLAVVKHYDEFMELLYSDEAASLPLYNDFAYMLLLVRDLEIERDELVRLFALKYKIAGYTGVNALIYVMYYDYMLLWRNDVRSYEIAERLKVKMPRAVLEKIEETERLKDVKEKPFYIHSPKKWPELTETSLYYKHSWNERVIVSFLNAALGNMSSDEVKLLNDKNFTYVDKGALLVTLEPDNVRKLYDALSADQRIIMKDSYYRGKYFNYSDMIYEAQQMFKRIRALTCEGAINIDLSLNDIVAKPSEGK